MRLIDADKFLKEILTAGIGKTIIEYSESDIGYMIRRQPTVDAVEVVRCKDCKHRKPDTICDDFTACEYLETVMPNSGFCSYGERKDVIQK